MKSTVLVIGTQSKSANKVEMKMEARDEWGGMRERSGA
jgi:hypothetical protein